MKKVKIKKIKYTVGDVLIPIVGQWAGELVTVEKVELGGSFLWLHVLTKDGCHVIHRSDEVKGRSLWKQFLMWMDE